MNKLTILHVCLMKMYGVISELTKVQDRADYIFVTD